MQLFHFGTLCFKSFILDFYVFEMYHFNIFFFNFSLEMLVFVSVLNFKIINIMTAKNHIIFLFKN